MCDTSVTWCVYSLALSPSLSVTGICCRPGTDARPFAPLSVMLLYIIFSNKATMIKRFSVLKPWPAASLLTTADKRFGIIKARWKRVYLIFKWLIRKERNCVCCLKSIHAIKDTFFKLWKFYMIILYTYDRGVAFSPPKYCMLSVLEIRSLGGGGGGPPRAPQDPPPSLHPCKRYLITLPTAVIVAVVFGNFIFSLFMKW